MRKVVQITLLVLVLTIFPFGEVRAFSVSSFASDLRCLLLDWLLFMDCEETHSSEPNPEPVAPISERGTSLPVSSVQPPPQPSPTPTPQTVTERIVTERVVERVEPKYITVTGIDEATLARKLSELENKPPDSPDESNVW